jgi:hypothetical protein
LKNFPKILEPNNKLELYLIKLMNKYQKKFLQLPSAGKEKQKTPIKSQS